MCNNEETARLWSEIMISLANSEAQSDLDRTNREEDRENVGRKRPAESRRERKMSPVKRQRVSKSSHKSLHNLSEKKKQRDLIRSKLETLKEITPKCPKSDIISILDSVIDYIISLQLCVFFLQYYKIPSGGDFL